MAEKYGSWTVCELKKELRRRNARLTGKKEDLIERLAAYDRNNNFLYNAVEDPVAEPFSNILWPPNEEFSSLQQSSNVPPIDIVHLNNYFLNVYKLEEGMSMCAAVHRKGYNIICWDKMFIADSCIACWCIFISSYSCNPLFFSDDYLWETCVPMFSMSIEAQHNTGAFYFYKRDAYFLENTIFP